MQIIYHATASESKQSVTEVCYKLLQDFTMFNGMTEVSVI